MDGGFQGGTGPDTFRLKIWDLDHGNALVYDSLVQTLDRGSIELHPS